MEKIYRFRFLIIGLSIILLFGFMSFSRTENNTGDLDNVVEILYPYIEGDINSTEKSAIGLKSLEEMVDAYNVVDSNPYEIKLVKLKAASYGEYINKRNSLFFSSDQPDLIYVVNYFNNGIYASVDPTQFINNGIALEVADKLENYDNIYDWLKNPYYIPTGFRQLGRPYLTETTKSLGIDEIPDIVTTELKKDYMTQWIEDRQPKLDFIVYQQMLDSYFPISLFYDKESKSVSMNREVIIARLNEIKRYINDGILDVDLLNDYEDTLILLQNPTGKTMDEIRERVFSFEYYLMDSYSLYNYGNTMIRPTNNRWHTKLAIEPGLIETTGFVFNRQGSDLEGALAFVDYTISNRVQKIYMSDRTPAYNGTVLTSVHDAETKKLWFKEGYVTAEGMAFWENYISFVEDGGSVSLGNNYAIIVEFHQAFSDLIPKYIFSDSYRESDLENDLRRLENAYMFRVLE